MSKVKSSELALLRNAREQILIALVNNAELATMAPAKPKVAEVVEGLANAYQVLQFATPNER